VSNKRISLLILLLVLAMPLYNPQAQNSDDSKKVEVSFSVTVRITAHEKLEATSKGSGPEALPSTDNATDRFTMTLQGEHRWTLDASEADYILGLRAAAPTTARDQAPDGKVNKAKVNCLLSPSKWKTRGLRMRGCRENSASCDLILE